ncbi:MAG: TlpA disulfide reductase family protein [Proteobacteria bacterium]|nr:TlpA disulfide reductase family protein [Pseudomonadota bacterium]
MISVQPRFEALALLVLLLGLVACEKQPPDFKDTAGNGYHYADFTGRYLVINYWATWCAPCRHEIPELNELAVTHSDDLVIFGVNFEEVSPSQMAQDVARMGITFPVYEADPSFRFEVDKPQVLPTTLIIDPDGKLMTTLVGPQTAETLLAAMGLAHEPASH